MYEYVYEYVYEYIYILFAMLVIVERQTKDHLQGGIYEHVILGGPKCHHTLFTKSSREES